MNFDHFTTFSINFLSFIFNFYPLNTLVNWLRLSHPFVTLSSPGQCLASDHSPFCPIFIFGMNSLIWDYYISFDDKKIKYKNLSLIK
jgi:hypothetical protein